MALNLNKNLKLYYSIKEVAEMFGLNESTLRFWETEFPFLKPKTAGPSKVRQYTEKDIEQVRLIHSLVKVRGCCVAWAWRSWLSRPTISASHPSHGPNTFA